MCIYWVLLYRFIFTIKFVYSRIYFVLFIFKSKKWTFFCDKKRKRTITNIGKDVEILELIYCLQEYKIMQHWGSWVIQSAEHPTLDFGSGNNIWVMGSSLVKPGQTPHLASPSPSALPSTHTCVCSISLLDRWIHLKNK